jgi:hypothetical protein
MTDYLQSTDRDLPVNARLSQLLPQWKHVDGNVFVVAVNATGVVVNADYDQLSLIEYIVAL